MLTQLYAHQIAGQCGKLTANLSAASGGAATAKCSTVTYIQGGHANFPIDCGGWMNGNCAGRWGGGLHIEGNPTTGFWGHNDTASYYIGSSFNLGTLNPWNFVVHGAVDVFGGTLFTNMFGN